MTPRPLYDPAPILNTFDPDTPPDDIATYLGVSLRTITAWKEGRTRINGRTHADRHAVTCGHHPAELWDNW